MLSAIAVWQSKNEDANIEEAGLFVKEIYVDGASMSEKTENCTTG